MKAVPAKLILALILLVGISAFFAFDLDRYLSFEMLRERTDFVQNAYAERPLFVAGIFFAVYVLVAALSLPGATVLTLAGGAFFGIAVGSLVVSFASSVGALLAFLVSRFVMSDFVRAKFGERMRPIDEGIKKDGAFYLFTIRLLPVLPFFVVNLVMGLTKIRASQFYIVSQIAMLPATLVYVNAGTQISRLESVHGILSTELIGSFLLLALFPWFAKASLAFVRNRKLYSGFKTPRRFDYDMVVIGAGSAGLVTAYISAAVKAKVALIEKHKMGGDCLNTGCVPSKALIRAARSAQEIRRAGEFGVKAGPVEVDFGAVMERIQKVIKEIEPHDSVERYAGLGVDCIQGEARLLSPFEVQVGERKMTTRNITLATGARPRVPSIAGLESVRYFTSDTIWSLQEKPKRLCVLGGGPIGCELAQAFARLGCEVTIVERGSRLLAREDEDVAAFCTERLQHEGIRVLVSHEAVRFESGLLLAKTDGADVRVGFDAVLIALGREANVTGFGLETLGIGVTPGGTIECDEYLRAKYPNIFVCGDAAGPFQFTHVAAHQAWYAAVNGLFRPFRQFKADYRVIPWCTYTDPEIARVGLSEQDAKAQGLPYVVSRYGIDDLDRAICDGSNEGFVKVLTAPGSDRILGATIVGAHAGDIISEFVLAMKHGLGLNKILGTIHIYPTFAEANKYAAGVWKRATAPQKVLKWLEKFHRFRCD